MAVEVEWRKLRADELRARARADAMVIVPVGSIEQHGPHLPVEVDSMLGETVALRTARLIAEKEPALVLPMLWTGLSEHHMTFGGTITLDLPTFYQVIRCICESIVRHGFRRIVLLNGHGGNDNALRCCADELTPKLGVPIVQFTYWYAAADSIAKILETQKALLHACEAETSMMMALRPDLVARDRIRLAKANATPDVKDLVGGGVYRWRTLGAMSSSGVWGNPEAASGEKGERLLAAIAQEIAGKLTNKEFWALPFLSEKVEP
jgi:creatinine amidohydrolase